MNDDNTYIVHLGLGSNIGDRSRALQYALDRIALLPDTKVLRCSGIYETDPWGDDQQERFLNCVLEVRTRLQPGPLLGDLKAVEIELGRVPGRKNGPRIIDIDILLYERRIVKLDQLRIPHPCLTSRRFVLVPLRELIESTRHPETGSTIGELTDVCPDTGTVRLTNVHLNLS